MMKESRIYNEEKTVSLINGVGNGFHKEKNKTGYLSYITKINSNRLKP